jgi:hypothetical protein
MHRFEITENVLCERNIAHLLASRNESAAKTNITAYNYLKKKQKLFKLKPLRKFRKKIKKKLKKTMRAIRNNLFPTASAQLV